MKVYYLVLKDILKCKNIKDVKYKSMQRNDKYHVKIKGKNSQ
jgi:hypothetical protein